jgi:prophage maintenance system killer protein
LGKIIFDIFCPHFYFYADSPKFVGIIDKSIGEGNKNLKILLLVTGGVFLQVNGYDLIFSEIDLYREVMALASGHMAEHEFAHLLKANSKKIAVA